ncbi:TonB-dependent receptor [Aquimarina mytili]|uniref:TonB-dependent receptor n=1 Tax=Aquimarina mytili TaxID=874423 RepID=A0A937D6Z5_9FLAO|nr:TonB-dependent receptor [Aquimarina mytili]
MKVNYSWHAIAALWLLFCIFSSHAQDIDNKIALIDVISDLEDRFQYKFTFADDTIEGIFVPPPNVEYSFEEVLKFLDLQTNLRYSILANNFVSINKKSSSFVICGVLKDNYTKSFLQGASVQGKKTAVISNSNGEFELEVFADTETIIIGHLGYNTLYRLANSFVVNECSEIFMDVKTETLSEVILSNYIVKGIDKTSDGSFQIDYKNFGILPGLIEADVLQTVQALPGIQSADETVSNINIRGGTHDQNLILWDGIKMYQSGHFFGLISAINPLITRKAKLLKNGTSPEFTDGVSGTMIMNTDTAINDDFRAGIGVNMINTDVFSDIPLGNKSSIQVTARKSIRDIAETPTYSQYSDRISQDSEVEGQNFLTSDIGFDFYDVNLRWNYNVTHKDKLRINFLTINNELVFSENATIDNTLISRQSSLSQNSFAGGVWYQRNWNDKFRSVLQIYETDYILKSINANLQQEQRFLQKNTVSETGLKLKGYYDFNDKITFLNGYQFIETGVSNLNDIDSPVFREKRDRVIRTHSLFSQIHYTPHRSASFNLGVRYNYNDKFNTHIVEPRLSYNQEVFKYFNIEILGEFKHQNTSQIINFQNDFLGIEKRRWVLSNDDDIPVIKSRQISLGLQYNRFGWLVNAEGYYKKVKGITARSQGFQNQYEFVRAIGDYTVKGVDFLLNKRYKNLSTWMSYSYAHNEYLFETFEERKFPNNIEITHSVTLGSSYSFRDFKISAGLNWNSGLPTTRPIPDSPIASNQINYQSSNSSRLDEYLRIDLSATYDFKISKNIQAHTGFSIWNLTDRQNVINNYYRINEQNLPQEVIESSLSITPNATFRVSF